MGSNVTYRQSNFFKSKCQVIAIICNCTSDRSIGFVRQVIEHFPYVDINNKRDRKPGTLELWGKKKLDQRYVLGLFTQQFQDDRIDQRLKWFKICLKKIAKQLPSLKSIAFPRKYKSLGCKCSYIKAIEDWAKSVPHIAVEIIEFEPPLERYLTPSSPSKDPDAQETDGEDYFETREYIEIETEVYDWVASHTNMNAVPRNQEKCLELAISLSALLLKTNPNLHRKIESIIPVEDDFCSILEQEASNTDLN